MAVHSSKRCKTCKYRAPEEEHNGCDFFLITGQRRGYTVQNCARYEKGPRVSMRKSMKTMIMRECEECKTSGKTRVCIEHKERRLK